MDYVQDNALQGPDVRQPGGAEPVPARLGSDRRRHAHPRHDARQVGKLFDEVERAALLPLAGGAVPVSTKAQRTVHRDGHVEVDKAYYSVPPEYLARRVWVRWDARLVRIFNERLEQIAVHVRHEPGRFSTQSAAHRRREDQRRRTRRGLAAGPGASDRAAAACAGPRRVIAGPRHRRRPRAAWAC